MHLRSLFPSRNGKRLRIWSSCVSLALSTVAEARFTKERRFPPHPHALLSNRGVLLRQGIAQCRTDGWTPRHDQLSWPI
jgi:hypothetical protein